VAVCQHCVTRKRGSRARLLLYCAVGLAKGSAGHCSGHGGVERRRRAPSWPAAERPIACFGDFQSFNFDRLPPFADHALSARGGEPEAHQLCQLVSRETVHAHDAFGAASRAATDEQRKRAALIGLLAARWCGARHCVMKTDQPILAPTLTASLGRRMSAGAHRRPIA
jgi:hypothetical protein